MCSRTLSAHVHAANAAACASRFLGVVYRSDDAKHPPQQQHPHARTHAHPARTTTCLASVTMMQPGFLKRGVIRSTRTGHGSSSVSLFPENVRVVGQKAAAKYEHQAQNHEQ